MALSEHRNPLRRSRERRKQLARNIKLAAAGALLLWLTLTIRRPYAMAGGMEEENRRLDRKLMETRLEVQNMRKELRALQSDGGMEREARRMGYVKQGEMPLVIPESGPAAAPPAGPSERSLSGPGPDKAAAPDVAGRRTRSAP